MTSVHHVYLLPRYRAATLACALLTAVGGAASSGRISMAGVNSENVERLAVAIDDAVRNSSKL